MRLIILLLSLLLPAAAAAQCEPSLELCGDLDRFVDNGCAEQPETVDRCRGLLEENAFEQAAIAEPEWDGEEWLYTQPMRFDDLVVEFEGNAPIYADEVARVHAEAAAAGALSARVAEQRDEWANNGTIASCEEYVHEKYLDHARFEDQVAHIAADHMAILEAAAEQPILGDALGAPLPEPSPFPPNPYLAAPIDLIASIPELAELVEVLADPDRLEEAPIEVPFFEDVEAAEVRRADAVRFEGLLEARAELDAALEANEDDEQIEAHFAAREALDEVLAAELVAASEAGCLDLDARCDLAPSLLADHLLKRYDEAREADYRRCKKATAINLEILGGAVDIAVFDDTLAEFEISLADQIQQAAAQAAQAAQAAADKAAKEAAAAKAQAKAAMAASGLSKLEENFAKTWHAGNAKFNAHLEYKLHWRVFGFEQILCNVNAKFEALFNSYVTVFKKWELLYAHFYLDLHDYIGDLRILGNSVYHKKQKLVGALKWNLAKGSTPTAKIKKGAKATFTVVFIPVSVEVGLAGAMGVNYELKAAVDKGGAACAKVDAYVHGAAKPYANLDGFAQLAIDIFIAKVGIGGKLQLLKVALPLFAKVGLSAPQGDIRKLQLTVDAGMNFALNALKGSLYLFGEAGWCPACFKGRTDIFKWKGVGYSTKVFGTSLSLPLLGLKAGS